MTAQFPPLSSAPAATDSPRAARMPDWPRLMPERMAADYLGIGVTMLREAGPAPLRSPGSLGRRVLWDRRDLDRWADALAGQPLDEAQAGAHSADVERAWFEDRRKRKAANG